MLCTGCGQQKPIEWSRHTSDLCADCVRILIAELKARRTIGPRFLAVFWNGKSTLGYGLYISNTACAAMGESLRVTQRNGWKLLRLDTQKTLADIFVDEDYRKYHPGTNKHALPYDSEKYGTVECKVPPPGWYCTREVGHLGPCAARPISKWQRIKRWLLHLCPHCGSRLQWLHLDADGRRDSSVYHGHCENHGHVRES